MVAYEKKGWALDWQSNLVKKTNLVKNCQLKDSWLVSEKNESQN
jgi:hypothetical protein